MFQEKINGPLEKNNGKIINKKRPNMLSSTILDFFDVI
jgi:hypothetical protein